MIDDVKLHITTGRGGVPLPVDAVTQTFAAVAIRGAGKTTLAAVIAEELLKQELPLVIIDPMGVFWGLRLGLKGKAKGGYNIPIFGGAHGDLPLEPGAGVLVAE